MQRDDNIRVASSDKMANEGIWDISFDSSTEENFDDVARNLNFLLTLTKDLQYYVDIDNHLIVTTDITDAEIISEITGRQIVINENVDNSDEDEKDIMDEDSTVTTLTSL
ncbi:hypothetical protein FQA39_LY14993 [Lamprigera yunnana]|nr:hypothetical protein FQA39_LY14993 [Lamprigera yunnana]